VSQARCGRVPFTGSAGAGVQLPPSNAVFGHGRWSRDFCRAQRYCRAISKGARRIPARIEIGRSGVGDRLQPHYDRRGLREGPREIPDEPCTSERPAMSFLQPWLLAALPLVALPIIIHLINQRRFQTIRWAAMMFLLAAQRMARGYSRLRQWLIMLFR